MARRAPKRPPGAHLQKKLQKTVAASRNLPVLLCRINRRGEKRQRVSAGTVQRWVHGVYGDSTEAHSALGTADGIFACGARGIISEPFTDYKAIARKHENGFLAGEGDNRILMRNNPDEIRAMVADMAKTAHMIGGYMMSIENHIPGNVPPEAVKRHLDLPAELAHR